MLNYSVYIIFRLFVGLFKILPNTLLYVISDFFAFILRFIVRYRYNVIIQNLKQAFPFKSDKEIRALILPIYRNITDLMVETMKGFTIGKKELQKRISTTNVELMHEMYEKHNGVIGVLGHYGNWEWAGLLAGLVLKQKTIALYKPLSNKYIDAYLRRNRSRFGIELCPIYITANTFDKYLNQKVFYALIADQSPSNVNKAIWTTFFNRDTACLHGPEKYAVKFSMPVIYTHIQRIRRGYYTVTFRILEENPASSNYGEITHRYMQWLEEYITQDPTQWLWSHRRWKHSKK